MSCDHEGTAVQTLDRFHVSRILAEGLSARGRDVDDVELQSDRRVHIRDAAVQDQDVLVHPRHVGAAQARSLARDLALRIQVEDQNGHEDHARHVADRNDLRVHREVYLGNLRHAAREAGKHGISLLIEPINGRDMPGKRVVILWGPHFTAQTAVPVPSAYFNVAAGDLDGDGLPDIAVPSWPLNSIAVCKPSRRVSRSCSARACWCIRITPISATPLESMRASMKLSRGPER